MNEEIYQLQDVLKTVYQWEEFLRDIDRDQWKEFVSDIVTPLEEAIEEAEGQLGEALSEAREYAYRCESLEDDLYYLNTDLDEMREKFQTIFETIDEVRKG